MPTCLCCSGSHVTQPPFLSLKSAYTWLHTLGASRQDIASAEKDEFFFSKNFVPKGSDVILDISTGTSAPWTPSTINQLKVLQQAVELLHHVWNSAMPAGSEQLSYNVVRSIICYAVSGVFECCGEDVLNLSAKLRGAYETAEVARWVLLSAVAATIDARPGYGEGELLGEGWDDAQLAAAVAEWKVYKTLCHRLILATKELIVAQSEARVQFDASSAGLDGPAAAVPCGGYPVRQHFITQACRRAGVSEADLVAVMSGMHRRALTPERPTRSSTAVHAAIDAADIARTEFYASVREVGEKNDRFLEVQCKILLDDYYEALSTCGNAVAQLVKLARVRESLLDEQSYCAVVPADLPRPV